MYRAAEKYFVQNSPFFSFLFLQELAAPAVDSSNKGYIGKCFSMDLRFCITSAKKLWKFCSVDFLKELIWIKFYYNSSN